MAWDRPATCRPPVEDGIFRAVNDAVRDGLSKVALANLATQTTTDPIPPRPMAPLALNVASPGLSPPRNSPSTKML